MKESKRKSKDKVKPEKTEALEKVETPEQTEMPEKDRKPEIKIEDFIIVVRNKQVMIDQDLATLYEVDVKRLNEQVRRNIERFPEHFRFQLTKEEYEKSVSELDRLMFLRSQIATIEKTDESLDPLKDGRGKHRKYLPYAFTEQGIAMISTVLRSDEAVRTSIRIMDAFVEMRKIIAVYAGLMQRMEHVERKQLETDQKFDRVLKVLEAHRDVPKEGIFFEGQVFEAYVLVTNIIKTAKRSIILIDNYIDESVLVLLGKKAAGVKVSLFTSAISSQLALDVQRANTQYPIIEVKKFGQSHDRFLIIDETEVYHLGASLKDLGKKWFAFCRMEKESVSSVINKIKGL
jgi:hypothetical protein